MVTIPHSRCPINLLRGWPSPSLHPTTQLASAAQSVFSDPSSSTPALQYGPDPGYEPLRTAISSWLSEYYNCPDDPQRICITGGASQNLACALQVFTDPNVTKRIWMVAPTYMLASRIFEDSGFEGRLRAVKEDGEGIDLDFLRRELEKLRNFKPGGPTLKHRRPWSKTYEHVIYAVPAFSNPSGKTMSLIRRQQLVALARDYNALIITDDVYDFLQWPNSPRSASQPPKALLPRISDIDRSLPPNPSDQLHFGYTMSNGSFSKILGPGVRTGWVDASPAFSYGISQCGTSRSGGCPSQLAAVMITELFQNRSLTTHINDVVLPAYRQRWNLMIRAIEAHLVPLGVKVRKSSLKGSDVVGGYFFWLELPPGVIAADVAAKAKESENLIVAHGELFEVLGDAQAPSFDGWVRVCFAWEEEWALVDGIERLSKVLVKMAKEVEQKPECASKRPADSFRIPMGEY